MTDNKEVLSKRLHISGLTPAISFDDLSRRLGSFGSVTALDGLGKLDALGQPRKFAYATLQTTKPQLSRCMNALSGSTWKGAKLRIGEAKPDFRERIILENAPKASDDTRARKRRRLARGVHGRHSQDMSLITPENVHQRPQWRVTPLGRLIRPMRMRPTRPLDPPLEPLRAKKTVDKGKGKAKKKKTRARAPPTRARKRTIDPLRWGSTHLSGIFLDGNGNDGAPAANGGESTEVEEVENILEASDQTPSRDDDETPPHAPVVAELDLATETANALGLLSTMFGEANADWGGAESVDSDVEMAGTIPHAAPGPLEPTDFEVIPADHESLATPRGSAVDRQAEATPTPTTSGPEQSSNKLKDLFAPREEEGLFSLIGHLDLDSELDLDMDLDMDESAFPNTAATSSRSVPPVAVPTMQHRVFDSSLPFFFPQKGHVQRVKFARTEDEAGIRTRWEVARGELTREWKRRHREAVKSRRRRGGEQVE